MSKNILLVDDDPIFLLIATKLIGKFEVPVNITSYHNGKLALDFLTKNYTSSESFIVLLDINMPVMNGWEFLDKLTNFNFYDEIEIYIVSSSTDEVDIQKAGTYTNVVKFISKPIGKEDYEDILS
ncbi:response regulator [Algoriphagus sp. D3-2-R+10]|uniref:response regulator n=1 Tax=Algoriphagus aurantiacus TaxID=3103948 RepID=UPI002B3C9C7A|nr:response regulator [Algoriphagus sp. D3-2-R+10]MEB2775427.1 response regulator [Algoriphagus sp. D3-2-R+10]